MYIYLIEANIGQTIQYKLGISKHPDKRLKQLVTANPNITGIAEKYKVKNREYANKIETLLHKTFSLNKINGEWFNDDILTKEIFIEKCRIYENNIKIYEQIKNNKQNYDDIG